MKKHIVLKSSILGVVTSVSMLFTAVQADQVDVQIMGINDFHGALDQTGSAYMPDGKISGAGTAAQLDAYMDQSQADFNQTSPNGTSIRVQAGDMVGASPANSGLLQDEPTVKVMNKIGIEYGTIGNHEFDEGLAEYNRIMTGSAPAADSTINDITKAYPAEASTQQIVIANVVDKTTNQIPYNWKPYAIKNIPVNNTSVNVGFIGVVTTAIPELVLKKNYEQYNFLDEAQTIVKYAKELRSQNVNAIVVLAHIPATSGKDGLAGDEMAAIMTKVNQLYPDNSIDIVFAGHNHVYTNGTVGNTRIVEALSSGKAYSDVRGTLDTTTQDFTATPSAKIIAVAPNVLKGSADIQAIVDDANTRVTTLTKGKIGTATTNTTISREINADYESALGDLITRAQLTIAKESYPDIDFAMTNNGGIRADLVVQPDGAITWGAAQAVQPFGNILQVVEMTGQDIYKALNEQYDDAQRQFLQMSGLKYTYTDSGLNDPQNPFKVLKAYKSSGEEIDPNATYKLVINDFLFGGGDGFKSFLNAKLLGAINPDTEVFIQYIKNLEASGQTVSASLAGTKTYVTVALESSTTNDPNGRHDLVHRVYRDRNGNVVATELVSDLFTANHIEKATPSPINTTTVKPRIVNTQSTTTKEQLPTTNSDEKQTAMLSLLGLVSLSFIGFSKKKKENK
ncbi:surface-anchored 5'-nucleotidase [Streptococcus hongkongensis]|nr:5'-nucleotidase [Streptococcus uberis]